MTRQPMRIAYVVTHSGGMGGLETHLLTLVRYIDQQEFAPIFILPETVRHSPFSQQLGEMGVPVRFHAMVRNKWDVRTLGSLARLLRHHAPHITHVHVPPTYDLYPFLAARLALCPVVVSTEHLASHQSLFRPLRTRLVKRAAVALQDRVITVCNYVRDLLLERAHLPPQKIVTIHNGIEIPAGANAVVSARGEIRSELSIDAHAPLVGMVARIDPWYKRFDDFLRASRDISREVPSAHFVIVGDGDRDYREALEELARSLGVADRVHFLGYRDDAPRVIGALDTLVLASDHEGFPLVTLEAMASGIPVVATALGGVGEQIVHGETGYLVPPRNAPALAEGILSVLRDPQRSREIAQRARRVVETRFDARGMAEKTRSLYVQLLTSKRLMGQQGKKSLVRVS